VRGGIVLCVVGVNVRVPDVNHDIVAGGRHAVFICGLPRRSDFNWAIVRSFDFSVDQTGTRKQPGEQQNQRSHGERHRTAAKAPCKAKTVPRERNTAAGAVRRLVLPASF
jgi:hypothetical protein